MDGAIVVYWPPFSTLGKRMLAPLPPNWQCTIRPLTHRNSVHTARQLARLELEHVHPLAHDKIVVWIYGAVGLVLDERHQCGQRCTSFIL